MNTLPPSVLTRSRRRLVILLIAIALTALALAGILSGTTARGASIYASIPSLGVIERFDTVTGPDLDAFARYLPRSPSLSPASLDAASPRGAVVSQILSSAAL